MRDFIYLDDMAAASVFVMDLDKTIYDQHTNPMMSHINVGFGSDITIAHLAETIKNVTGYRGEIKFDSTKPDGTPRKWMDSRKLNPLGWRPNTSLEAGLSRTYFDFISLGK